MTAGQIFTIICSVVALIASVVAIVTFFVNRGKDKYNEGNTDGGIRGDIKYMRNNFDDLRLDVKEIARKQDVQAERLTRVEESVKSAHKRIDGIEKHEKNSKEE